jgi:phage/conjugal plasmid C-4 type zinc finger TraR family protein
MDLTERDFEMAAQATGIEVSTAVQSVRNALSRPGSEKCEDCDSTIPKERRAAMPSATRCVHCQSVKDRESALYRFKH